MNLIRKIYSLSIIVFLIPFAGALAGGKEGGGGKGVKCTNRVMSLELYEAKMEGLPDIPPPSTLAEVIRPVSEAFLGHFSSESLHDQPWIFDASVLLKNEIEARLLDIPAGERLPWTNDATLPQIDQGCKFVQVLIYSDDGHIYRDAQYWSMMNTVDQAALLMHEFIYKRARDRNLKTNSDETRKLVSAILHKKEDYPILKPLWNISQKLSCTGGIEGTPQKLFHFYAVPSNDHNTGTKLYFYQFFNFLVTAQTTANLSQVSLSELKDEHFDDQTFRVTNQLTKQTWEVELRTVDHQMYIRVINDDVPGEFSSVSCH